MNTTDEIIAIAYGIATIVGTLIAVGLWSSTRKRQPIDARKLGERELVWLMIVTVALLALLFGTIFFTPYGKTASQPGALAAGDPPQVVTVRASQFVWQISPASVRAGQPVEFRIRSSDVNHGFGVYAPTGELVFQIQVVPNTWQTEVHTFRRRGTYQVLCLEFCGAGHHLMQSTFEVR